MPYCRSCGAEVHDGDAFCTNCGAPQSTVQTVTQAEQPGTQNAYQAPYTQNSTYNPYQPYSAPPSDATQNSGNVGWGFLGCCFPLVGLILFLCWKDTKPQSAKAAGIGALISVILCVIMYILLFAIAGIGAYLTY